jgi:predicted transcriptional regulator
MRSFKSGGVLMKYNFNNESLNTKITLLERLNSELKYSKKLKQKAVDQIKQSTALIKRLKKKIKEEQNLINYDLIQEKLELKNGRKPG